MSSQNQFESTPEEMSNKSLRGGAASYEQEMRGEIWRLLNEQRQFGRNRPMALAWGRTAEERAAFVDSSVPEGTRILRVTATPQSSIREQVLKVRRQMSQLIPVEDRPHGDPPSFVDLFRALFRMGPHDERMVLHVENVPLLLRDPSAGLADFDFPSELNAAWEDPRLPRREAKCLVLLSGDDKEEVQYMVRGDQPLYGRVSRYLDLRPRLERTAEVVRLVKQARTRTSPER